MDVLTYSQYSGSRPHSIYDSSTVGEVGISAATSLLANF